LFQVSEPSEKEELQHLRMQLMVLEKMIFIYTRRK
jgi:hypothetical protein